MTFAYRNSGWFCVDIVDIYAKRDQNKINGLMGLMNVTTQITELPQENHLILESTKLIYQYIIFRLSSSTTVCC